VIITAACYQEETSDLRPAAPLLRLPGQKCRLSVASLHETGPRTASLTAHFLSSFLCVCYSTPRPTPHLLPHTHPYHPLYSYVRMYIDEEIPPFISLSLSLSALNPPPPPPLLSLSTSPLGSSNEAPHCPRRSQSSIKRKEKVHFNEVKANPGVGLGNRENA